jgi:hypothetical protein
MNCARRLELIPISDTGGNENHSRFLDSIHPRQDHGIVLLDLLRKQRIAHEARIRVGFPASLFPCFDEIAGVASMANKWVRPGTYIQRWRWAKVFDRKGEGSCNHSVRHYLNCQFRLAFPTKPRTLTPQKSIFAGVGGDLGGLRILAHGMELEAVDYSLRERSDCEQERENSQCGIGIFGVADED